MVCVSFGTSNKKSKYIILLHRSIRAVLCVEGAVFGGEAEFGHHGKGGLVERVHRVVWRDAKRVLCHFWTFATSYDPLFVCSLSVLSASFLG